MFAAYGARRVMRLAKRKSVQRALYVLGCCALAFLTFGTLQKTMTAEREPALAGDFRREAKPIPTTRRTCSAIFCPIRRKTR